MATGELACWPALDNMTDGQLEQEITMAEQAMEDNQHTIEQCRLRLDLRRNGR